MLAVVAKGVGVLAVVLTLDASVHEFAELVSLSDDARRARLDLPLGCIPKVSAVKPAASTSGRLTVFVDCSPAPTAPASPIEPASWKDR